MFVFFLLISIRKSMSYTVSDNSKALNFEKTTISRMEVDILQLK